MEPDNTTNSHSSSVSKTTKKNFFKQKGIALIIILLLIAICVVIGLNAAGVIDLGTFFKNPTPSATIAEEVCTGYGNIYESKNSDDVPEELKDYLVGLYSCRPKDEDAKSSNAKMSFELYEFNEDARKIPYFKEKIDNAPNNYSSVSILENSNSYFKALSTAYQYVSYEAIYKKFYVAIDASSIEFAEDVLVKLEFPDRNRTTTVKYETEVNAIDNHNQEILDRVAAALLTYQVKEGNLPIVMPDNSETNKQTNIDGTGTTEYDVFYNSLGDLKGYSGEQYTIDVMDPTIEIDGSWDERSDNIFIRYGYYCNTYDGENYYAQNASNREFFAVTLRSAKGGSICAGTTRSEKEDQEYFQDDESGE